MGYWTGRGEDCDKPDSVKEKEYEDCCADGYHRHLKTNQEAKDRLEEQKKPNKGRKYFI